VVARRDALAYDTPVANTDMVGGIPLLSIAGTPRTIGEELGQRLKPHLHVLSRHLAEQVALSARAEGRQLTSADVRERLRRAPPMPDPEPGLAMELESMARAAELAPEDLQVIHGYADLLGALAGRATHASSFIALTGEQTASRQPAMALVLEADPALLPYLTLVHRIPSHGPASLSLTIAGLHPMAFLNQAGIAGASNAMVVTDGEPGYFSTHVLGSLTSTPSFDDAVSRAHAGPRWGGRAIHLLAGGGERCSLELSGQRVARLPDGHRGAPRVHTNHPMDESIQAVGVAEAISRHRLEQIAGHAIRARDVDPLQVLDWFGLASGTGSGETTTRRRRASAATPDACISLWIAPASREFHLRLGRGAGMDSFSLGTGSARSARLAPAAPSPG
jgi:hypothetical protein